MFRNDGVWYERWGTHGVCVECDMKFLFGSVLPAYVAQAQAGAAEGFVSMNPFTKTWLSLGLVLLALFEFWSAMQVFGVKRSGPYKATRSVMFLHRAFGYLFLVGWLLLMFVGLDMYEHHHQAGNYTLNARTFSHVFLAMLVLVLLLLKISFVRLYQKLRRYAAVLGIAATVLTLVLWGIVGLLFIFMMGGVQPG